MYFHSVEQDAGNSTEEEEEGIGHIAIKPSEPVHIEDFRPSTSNIIQNEYSYCVLNSTNHLMTQIWAGPSHWKLKHVRPAGKSYKLKVLLRFLHFCIIL